MSKVCKNCNAIVDDDSRFCTQCGSKEFIVSEAPQPAPQQQYYAPQQDYVPASKKKSNKKLIAILASVLAVVVAGVILIIALAGGNSYEDIFDNMVDAVINGEFEKMEELLPPDVLKKVEEKEGQTFEEMLEQNEEKLEVYSEYIRGKFEDRYGDDFKLEYEIIEANEVSESKLKKIAAALEKEYGVDADDVEDVRDLKIETTVTGSKKEETNTSGFSVVKYDGSWYPLQYKEKSSGKITATFMNLEF